jgi:hypothetical protein
MDRSRRVCVKLALQRIRLQRKQCVADVAIALRRCGVAASAHSAERTEQYRCFHYILVNVLILTR